MNAALNAPDPLEDYLNNLFTRWCECSPYGDQVPDEWPELMAAFAAKHAGKDRDHMAELFSEGDGNEPFEKLLESIFDTACQFILRDLSDAVFDRNFDKLKLIGITELKPPPGVSTAAL